MKRYIKASSDGYRYSITDKRNILHSEKMQPVIDRILDRYTQITGFKPVVQKYMLNSNSNGTTFRLECMQYYDFGYIYLSTYQSAKAIPVMATESDIVQYSDMMIDILIRNIQTTFSSEYTLNNVNSSESDTIIQSICDRARCADVAAATQFIHELLDNGEVVNKLID